MYIIKDYAEPFFHQGLGIWIKSKKQLRDELRARNLTEVGNEITEMNSKDLKKRAEEARNGKR